MRNPHHEPRVAHCTGCGKTFKKMHWMINHRRVDRCGGRFLPVEERLLRLSAHAEAMLFQSTANDYHYFQWRDYTQRANRLRNRRLAGNERRPLSSQRRQG